MSPPPTALYVHDAGGGGGRVMAIAIGFLAFQAGVGAAAFALYQVRAFARPRRGA